MVSRLQATRVVRCQSVASHKICVKMCVSLLPVSVHVSCQKGQKSVGLFFDVAFHRVRSLSHLKLAT